jgi:hypothetical protein
MQMARRFVTRLSSEVLLPRHVLTPELSHVLPLFSYCPVLPSGYHSTNILVLQQLPGSEDRTTRA